MRMMKIRCDREESALESVKAVERLAMAFERRCSTYSMDFVGVNKGLAHFIGAFVNRLTT